MKKICLHTTFILLFIGIQPALYGQCSLITDNFSGQYPSSVCAPVTLDMEVRYKFFLPVDPSKVEILYIWNDGTGAVTQVPAISQGDTIFTQTQSHVYPPANECSYTAEAFVVYDGEICTSSSRQQQTFSAWARDNENGAVLTTDPVVAEFCEGEDIVDVTFDDNSAFNCNINIEPDKPNRLTRWVQFIYGTQTNAGDRIPNVSIEDESGNTYQLTDAAGNSLGTVAGPIVEIPAPADGPDQTSWKISAPAGADVGDIFEITLRNWNICNPYDATPFDGNPPADIIDGDNPPITTTALIEIIDAPDQIADPAPAFCTDEDITLTVAAGGGNLSWYSDAALTQLVHTGNDFDPTEPPVNLDNSIAQTDTFYVVEENGQCSSPAGEVTLEIIEQPTMADAGEDTIICGSTYELQGNAITLGQGTWTTTGGAIIDDENDPNTAVSNLDVGPNTFRWTTANSSCTTFDEVIITRDVQPTAAQVGNDTALCSPGTITLNGNAADQGGTGTWSILTGSATISDPNDPDATLSNPAYGSNILVWEIHSQYGNCPVTSDTIEYTVDLASISINAQPDTSLCQTNSLTLSGTPPLPGESALWSAIGTSAAIEYPDSAITTVNNLEEGMNQFVYRLQSNLGICPVLHDTISIERFILSAPANAGSDIAVCDSHSVELSANIPAEGTGSWHFIDQPSGSTPQITPDSSSAHAEISIDPGDEGRYTLVWRIENGACLSEDTLLVDFGIPPPQASASPDTIVCGNTMQIMGNTGKGLYGKWDVISGPTPVDFVSGDTASNTWITIPDSISGQYVLTWTLSSGSCTPQSDTITLTFKKLPAQPLTTNDSSCVAGPVTLKADVPADANYLNWYTSSSGGTSIGNFDSIHFSNLTQDTVFWVSSFNDTSGCESPRKPITGKIFNIPDLPTLTDQQFCGPDTFEIAAQPGQYGNTIRWYNTTGNTLLFEGDTFIYTAPQSDTLLASSYNSITGCEGEKDTIVITIYNTPAIPVAPDVAQCDSGTVTLTATPGAHTTHLYWYEDSLETTLYDTGVSITTPYIGSPESYWLKAVNDASGCAAPIQEVRALVYPEPGLPLVSDTSRCGAGEIFLPSQPGSNANTSRWYTAFSGGTLLDETNQYEIPFLNAGNYSYWVSSYDTLTTCESERTRLDVDIFPTPGPNPIVGNTTVPKGEPNALYSMTENAGSSYEWFIPSGADTSLINHNYVILSFPDTGNFQLVGRETNVHGCPGPLQSKNITVIDSVFRVNLSAKYPEVCEGNTLSVNAMPTGGTPSYSFEWWADTAHVTQMNAGNIDFTATSSGNYTLYVKVTDVNFREAFDTVFITVNPNPSIAMAISDTIVCAGSSEILNTHTTGGSGSYAAYSWSGNTGPLSSTSSGSPTFNSNTKGFYPLKVEVTDSKGCIDSTSITIKNELPLALFEPNDPDPCSPVAYTFANNSIDAVAYTWNFGDDSPAVSDTSPTHQYINEGSSIRYYNVELTAYSENGCMNKSMQTVLSYPNPANTINMEPEVACEPAEVLLYASPGNFQYHWDFGDGTTITSGYSINHVFTNHGAHDTTYQIQLITESSFGCQDTAQRNVTVYPSPFAEFEVIPQVMNYPDSAARINNLTVDRNWSYSWDFDDHKTSQERNPGEHIYEAPGIYDIQLVVRGEHCSDSTTRRLRIQPAAPVAKFAPVEPGCEPHTVAFKNTSQYANSYLWEFGDGSVSNKPNPTYTYYEYGKYKIKLTVEGQGGTDTTSRETEVYILPHAEFRASPRQVFVNDQPVQFFNTSVNAETYLWDFGDGAVSTDQNPEHVYKQEGSFDVLLTVNTANNCYDTYELKNAVLVEPSGKILYPNVFRPASPTPERQVFKPAIIDEVDEYHLMIFNRWGELIYESFDQETGWDGRVNGSLAPQDVYVWKVKGTYVSGQSFVKSGDVTLLR